MSRSTPPESTRSSQGDGAPASPEPALSSEHVEGEDVDSLRRLLLGEDREAVLDRLAQEGLDTIDIDRLAAALPQAVEKREQRDDALARSLAQTIENGLKTSVERDPKPIIDVIFPIIGPAIRKAVRSAISSATERMNQALTYGLSWKGLLWRFEASRKGVSFGEIVLRHTLTYRVEQVFLLHRETGLLLQHVVDPAIELEDPALVSSMLTAISQFVEDSFDVEDEDSLDSINVGDLSVLVEVGPRAALAAVVRGHPPEELRITLRETLEEVHEQYRTPLASFSGDDAPFRNSADLLRNCLDSRFAERPKKGFPLKAVLIVFVLLGLLGWWGWTTWQQGAGERAYLKSLGEAPGVEVLRTEHENGRLKIVGIREVGAPNPADLIEGTGLDAADVSERWFTVQAPESGPTVDEASQAVEAAVVHFVGLSPVPDELEAARNAVAFLAETARGNEESVALRILGHADKTGTDVQNRQISEGRGTIIEENLTEFDLPVEVVPRSSLDALGLGASPESRRVTFEVVRNAVPE